MKVKKKFKVRIQETEDTRLRQGYRLRSHTHFGGQDGVARDSAQSGNVGMIE